MKLITKTDELGNLWLLLGADKSSVGVDYQKLIKAAISDGKLNTKRATATEIAKACCLDETRKPIIDAVAKNMRLMGYDERRRGNGKYFIIQPSA